jgi:hypothetical protein
MKFRRRDVAWWCQRVTLASLLVLLILVVTR